MTDRELLEQWLRPGAIVPVTMEATRILVEALRARLAQPEPEVKWDASAPLVVHPHPAFQTTQPQQHSEQWWRHEVSNAWAEGYEKGKVFCACGDQIMPNDNAECGNCVTARNAVKPQPVAWMHNFIDEVVIAHRPVDLDRHPDRWTPLYKDPTPCQTCESLARTVMMDQTYHDSVMAQHRKPPTQDLSAPLTVNGVPMYPQREWQGLTDEEIREFEIWLDNDEEEHGWNPPENIVKYLEAKLREKNHG